MRGKVLRGWIASVALCTVPATVHGQSVEAGAPGAGCIDPVYRQLDFRLGEFEVTVVGGRPAGLSRVEPVLGGCLIVEHWRGAISGYGRANFYHDRVSGVWRMLYVTDEGDVLQMSGAMDGTKMVLTGQNEFNTFTGLHRMRFSPLPGGGHKQFWDFSTDGGASWTSIHEGNYARIAGR